MRGLQGTGDVAITRLIVALGKPHAIRLTSATILAGVIQVAEHMGDDERADYYMQELKKISDRSAARLAARPRDTASEGL